MPVNAGLCEWFLQSEDDQSLAADLPQATGKRMKLELKLRGLSQGGAVEFQRQRLLGYLQQRAASDPLFAAAVAHLDLHGLVAVPVKASRKRKEPAEVQAQDQEPKAKRRKKKNPQQQLQVEDEKNPEDVEPDSQPRLAKRQRKKSVRQMESEQAAEVEEPDVEMAG